MRALLEIPSYEFDEDAYHDSPSFLSSSREDEEMHCPTSEKNSFNIHRANSAAWKTLVTILPRAARLPALGSLLQHNVFVEPKEYSFFSKEHKDMVTASLEYLQVKLFT